MATGSSSLAPCPVIVGIYPSICPLSTPPSLPTSYKMALQGAGLGVYPRGECISPAGAWLGAPPPGSLPSCLQAGSPLSGGPGLSARPLSRWPQLCHLVSVRFLGCAYSGGQAV